MLFLKNGPPQGGQGRTCHRGAREDRADGAGLALARFLAQEACLARGLACLGEALAAAPLIPLPPRIAGKVCGFVPKLDGDLPVRLCLDELVERVGEECRRDARRMTDAYHRQTTAYGHFEKVVDGGV